MISENKIIKRAIVSREAFDKLRILKVYENLNNYSKNLWEAIEYFYDNSPDASKCDTELIQEYLENKFPNKGQVYENIIEKVKQEEVEDVNLEQFLLDILIRNHEVELADSLLRGDKNRIKPSIEKYIELLEASSIDDEQEYEQEQVYEAVPVPELVSSIEDRRSKYILCPKALEEETGGLMPGDNIILFGRPESGKSLIAIALGSYLLAQGARVLSICNEDSIHRIMMRYLSSITGLTEQEIKKDPHKAAEISEVNYYHNIRLVHMSPGSFREIREHIEDFHPDILIVDQLRNLNVGKQENKVIQMEEAAKQLRRFAGRYGLISIGITQAGDSAEGKVLLDKGDVDFSNTGVPGAADLLIGIGVNQELERANRRILNICKNKLTGKHTAISVRVNPFLSRVYDE